MREIFPDLWQTEPEHPFAGLTTHAYLLLRDDGNVLFYNSSHRDDHARMADLGGVARQYLSHQDEVGPSLVRIRERFGSQLCCHRDEAAAAREISPVDVTYNSRETHLGTIEVIPTPGHTRGSTCFLVASPRGRTYLFTGDTIYVGRDGRWHNGYLEGMSDKATLKTSLELLRGLEPDVVLSSASVGDVPYREVTPQSWRAGVDEALAGLS
ncbi:MAG: MBL fold metallo-hydrolase [Bacteroidota bacterium]|nr:MBL fold metallo-hydrolase [Kiloniellaceae bacterium]